MTVLLSCCMVNIAQANLLADSDLDGVPDVDEINVYFTDVNKQDTDGDGYSDWLELVSGYSPHNKESILFPGVRLPLPV